MSLENDKHSYQGQQVNQENRQVIGALVCGQIADWIGRRYTIVLALIISFAAITMEFVATTDELFFGGKFLNGFAVGTLQAVAGTYIGEVGLRDNHIYDPNPP